MLVEFIQDHSGHADTSVDWEQELALAETARMILRENRWDVDAAVAYILDSNPSWEYDVEGNALGLGANLGDWEQVPELDHEIDEQVQEQMQVDGSEQTEVDGSAAGEGAPSTSTEFEMRI